MDQISEQRLASIIAAGPDSITEADAAFLRARSSYLAEEQRTKFAAVLRGVPVEDAAAQEEASEEKPAKQPKPAK